MFPQVQSPYSNVTNAAWAEAREEAMDRIWEREGVEREPTREEIDQALERRLEAICEWRKAL